MMNSSSILDITIDEYERSRYEKYGQTIVAYFSIFTVLGILGNVHVLLVYGREKMMSNYQIFIVALALNDLLACLFVIPFESIYIRYHYTFKNTGSCKCFRFMSTALILCSYFLLGLIAVERYRRICRPFQDQLTKPAVLKASGIVLGISCSTALPILVFYDIVPRGITKHPSLNATECAVWNSTFKSVYFSIIFLINTAIIIIIVAVYSMIARVIYRQRRFAHVTLSSNKNDLNPESENVRFRHNTMAIRNTITLILITALSYVGSIPIVILILIRFANGKMYEQAEETLGTVGLNILRRGYFISNIINPLVYIIIDNTFRNGITRLYMTILTFLKYHN